MPRRLKTYITTSGFYDLAVAAPSMKAALEIWGSRSNLFHQGFARGTDDADIVKATMEHPGIVLRRAVGTKGAFKERADLPKLAALQSGMSHRPAPASRPKKTAAAKPSGKTDSAAGRAAARLYDLAQERREREEQRAEAQRQKERKHQAEAIGSAQAALDKARARHETRTSEIEREREKLDRKERDEAQRWRDEKERLEAALNRARGGAG